MVGDMDANLGTQSLLANPIRCFDLYLPDTPRCKDANYFVTELWKRSGIKMMKYRRWKAKVYEELQEAARLDSTLSKHLINQREFNLILDDRDLDFSRENRPPPFELSLQELKAGAKWLEEINIEPSAKIVLLLGRDPKYGTERRDDPEKHTHRNMNINTFSQAALELADRGFYVFRMGTSVEDKFQVSDEARIFDYATNGMRTEFRDVFLSERCSLLVAVSSGFDALPIAFRKPIVTVNHPCVGSAPFYNKNCMVLCKDMKDVSTHQTLTIDELYRRDILFELYQKPFDEANCRFVDNTEAEIRDTTIEALDHLLDKIPYSNHQNDLQDKFKSEFEKYCYLNAQKFHSQIKSRYSTAGLLSGHFGLR